MGEIASLRSQRRLREEHGDEAMCLWACSGKAYCCAGRVRMGEIASLRSQRRLREEHGDEAICLFVDGSGKACCYAGRVRMGEDCFVW